MCVSERECARVWVCILVRDPTPPSLDTPSRPVPVELEPLRGGGRGAEPGTAPAPQHRARSHLRHRHRRRSFPRTREPNALLELVKWNQINCSMDLVPFNQL